MKPETQDLCSIPGCGKAFLAKGFCNAHYKRWQRHGDPLGGRTPDGEPLAFLEAAVLPSEGDGCLIWPYSKCGKGYARIWREGKMRCVSRIVCWAERGPPPTPEHEAAHLCGKGHLACCNPKHLVWKTRSENQADRLIHGTHSRGERSGCSKLTEAEVTEIRASTTPTAKLATKYRVSQQQILDIKARKSWAWMGESTENNISAMENML